MRERVVGSAIVVFAGLAPTLFGGPVFAIFMVVLGVAGFREYAALTTLSSEHRILPGAPAGTIVLAAMSAAALVGTETIALFIVVIGAVAVPLIALLASPPHPGAVTSWALSSAGLLYLGLPVYAAVALRATAGGDTSPWLTALADIFSLGWESAPAGLAWTLTVIMATWVGDSTAFLVGRSLGRTRLAPRVSPGKTVEGAIGGLLASSVIGGAAIVLFGLGPWWIGVIGGCLIGFAGQIGDLCESFLKRQAGVKDSGTLLPGHGGVLDRIDALLFAFPVGLVLAAAFQRLGAP